MGPDGRRPHHRNSGRPRNCAGLDVEIVQHLDVVAQEADRDHDFWLSIRNDGVTNVRFEPRLPRIPAPALKGQFPVLTTDGMRRQTRTLPELLDIRVPTPHRYRDA